MLHQVPEEVPFPGEEVVECWQNYCDAISGSLNLSITSLSKSFNVLLERRVLVQ